MSRAQSIRCCKLVGPTRRWSVAVRAVEASASVLPSVHRGQKIRDARRQRAVGGRRLGDDYTRPPATRGDGHVDERVIADESGELRRDLGHGRRRHLDHAVLAQRALRIRREIQADGELGEVLERHPVRARGIDAPRDLVEAKDDGPPHPGDPANALREPGVERLAIEVWLAAREDLDEQFNRGPSTRGIA